VRHYFQNVSFYKLTKYWGGKHIRAFMLGSAQCSKNINDESINVTHFFNSFFLIENLWVHQSTSILLAYNFY
jgi:hypothetical protein